MTLLLLLWTLAHVEPERPQVYEAVFHGEHRELVWQI